MRTPFGLTAVAFVAALSGCTVLPTIEVTKLSDPAEVKGDELDTYAIQQSSIKIAQSGSKKLKDVEVPVLEVTSVPSEYAGFKVGIRRADSLGVRTNINITKFSNTELPKEIGTEVVDTRIDTIGKIGSVVTKVIGVYSAGKGELDVKELPKQLRTLILLDQNKVGRGESTVDAGDNVTIKFGPLPVDAFEATLMPASRVGSSLVFAACRSAQVTFELASEKHSYTVKISDPRYLQRVSLPLKGKLSFHTECGVSVEANKDTGVASSMAVADALMEQLKAIKDAADKK